MKNSLFISLLLSIILLSSCGDDDGGTVNVDGQLSFDGETSALTHAYIEGYGENDNGSFDVDISLTSKPVNDDEESTNDISIVYLDLNTSIENVLEAGTYTYADERDVFKLVDGRVAINASFNIDGELTQGKEFEVTGGMVTVSVSSNVYTISFNLTGANDARATGSFTGTLTPFESD